MNRLRGVLGLFALSAGCLVAELVSANGEALFLECPCEVSSNGTTLSITAAIRSFRPTASGALSLGVSTARDEHRIVHEIARVGVSDSLPSGATLPSATYQVQFDLADGMDNERDIELILYEQENNEAFQRDRVRMAGTVVPGSAFQVGHLDFLEDTDGDGVGDVNERLEGTDPLDSASTPADPIIDVVALHSQGVPAFYDGDPSTRIAHMFALANAIVADSGVGLSFRLVGLSPVHMDETNRQSSPSPDAVESAAQRHGADAVVLFRMPGANSGYCGVARLGGIGTRGRFDFESERGAVATVIPNCGAATLAHEIGHVMGLGHSSWQTGNAPVGTWRWSRGHAVDRDFGTLMTYGPQNGPGTRLQVFSAPDNTCMGVQDQPRPCGLDRREVNGADAMATLEAVRFQFARFRASQPDGDGDGYVDGVDDLPSHAGEWRDTDGDGVGDNADADDDGDGVDDAEDAFPLDGSETVDTDDDGVGDNADAFPQNPLEALDADADGVGDNADAFPDDPGEWSDSDGDGVGDNADAFPENSRETADTDGDGVGDNADPDADGDGFYDHIDLFPLDAAAWDIASYLITGESPGDLIGDTLSGGGAGDKQSFIVGAQHHQALGNDYAGAAYLVAGADLEALDAADGLVDRVIGLGHAMSGAHSWKFIGDGHSDYAGRSVFSTGDLDGDEVTDVIVGAPGESGSGAAYLVSGADFAAADEADLSPDHVIQLDRAPALPDSWKFLGETKHDRAGIAVAAMPDSDGDGKAELLIGASGHRADGRSGTGAVYLAASGDLADVDAADGAQDGIVHLSNLTGGVSSWKLVDGARRSNAGYGVAAFDVDADGTVEIILNAPYGLTEGGNGRPGAVYVISTADLPAADQSDGAMDRVVELRHLVAQPHSWRLQGGAFSGWAESPAALAGKTDGFAGWLVIGTYVLSAADLAGADAADDSVDGTVDMQNLVLQGSSWQIGAQWVGVAGDSDGDASDDLLAADFSSTGALAHLVSPHRLAELDPDGVPVTSDGEVWRYQIERDSTSWTIRAQFAAYSIGSASAGDVDADGINDHLLGNSRLPSGDDRGSVFLLLSTDLSGLDRGDGAGDRRMLLDNLAGDTDRDGVSNTLDRDDDGDGIPDIVDRYQLDPTEWADTDGDNVPDNADAFPLDGSETHDTDGDGLGDDYADDDDDGDGIPDSEDAQPFDTDNDGIDNAYDDDDDNDGIPDIRDGLPLNSDESADTDGDGTGDNADTDDDDDGVPDSEDAFPLDAQESTDTDGDGVGDNADALPFDPNEHRDDDGDGIGNRSDPDDDGDGIPDTEDAFPLDAEASADADGDGVPDARDAFPADPAEWLDTDGSGVGNNADTDDDGDNVMDEYDLYPLDASRHDLTSFQLKLGDEEARSLTHFAASAGDLDGDGIPELLISPPAADDAGNGGEVYIVSPHDLAVMDEADGAKDGLALIDYASSQLGSWKLVGESGYAIDSSHSLGDLNDDGVTELFVSADARLAASYVVSGTDLLAADAADGLADGTIELERVASQPGSWKIRGYWQGGFPRLSRPADMDSDGSPDLAIGHPGQRNGDAAGRVYVVPVTALASMDAADGTMDGVISPKQQEDHKLWQFIGERPLDQAGSSVTLADFDGDGTADIAIGAPGHDSTQADEGALYLISGADLAALDIADSAEDKIIELGQVAAQPNSWKLVSGRARGRLGDVALTADLGGDGHPDFVLFSEQTYVHSVGRVFTWNHERFAAIDAADGVSDGVLSLEHVAAASETVTTPRVPRFMSADFTDFDGDGTQDLLIGLGGLIGSEAYLNGTVAYFISGSALSDAGSSDTTVSEWFEIGDETARSYRVFAPELFELHAQAVVAVAEAGDVDADGRGDILLTVEPTVPAGRHYRSAYLLNGADLPLLDAEDGIADGQIFLSSIVRDRR